MTKRGPDVRLAQRNGRHQMLGGVSSATTDQCHRTSSPFYRRSLGDAQIPSSSLFRLSFLSVRTLL
jgi:hypothetical protein